MASCLFASSNDQTSQLLITKSELMVLSMSPSQATYSSCTTCGSKLGNMLTSCVTSSDCAGGRGCARWILYRACGCSCGCGGSIRKCTVYQLHPNILAWHHNHTHTRADTVKTSVPSCWLPSPCSGTTHRLGPSLYMGPMRILARATCVSLNTP